MSTLVAEEDLESTRGERFLAFVFAVFVVIGLIWGYAKLDEPFQPPQTVVTDPAVAARDAARDVRDKAAMTQDSARTDLELAREAYRTAMEAGQPTENLQTAYQQAQTRQEEASTALTQAEQRLADAEPAAQAAEKRLEAERSQTYTHARLLTFLARLAYVIGTLVLSFWALTRYRRRAARRAPLLYATVGATSLLALIMATDYITDYIDLPDLGPLVLSLVGIALSFAAFVALQRVLVRRVPERRVRRGDCPFCGYPVRRPADGTAPSGYCEGCGRDVVGECTSCSAPRRVGTRHCAACGAA